MNNSLPESVAKCDCDCGTGQTKSTIACPTCRKLGSTVNLITPKNTITKDARTRLNPEYNYHFCDNPDCETVYYNEQDTTVFTASELKNRVTLKNDSPKTPLCYCFKVLKVQALEEVSRTGTTDVFKTIQAKMKPGQSCFCEKSNPRGDTCVKDIQDWLETQGVTMNQMIEETQKDDCCEGERPEEIINAGCCGTEQTTDNTKGGCCG